MNATVSNVLVPRYVVLEHAGQGLYRVDLLLHLYVVPVKAGVEEILQIRARNLKRGDIRIIIASTV